MIPFTKDFIELGDDLYNINYIIKIERCGTPKGRWWRIHFVDGFYDPNEIETKTLWEMIGRAL